MEEIDFDSSLKQEKLDNSWIEEFENEEYIYKDFYKEEVQEINVILFYIDNNNSITSGKKVLIPLNKGILEKKILIKILNENMNYNNKKYRPISLLKWNMDLEPDLLIKYLKDELDDVDSDFINIESEIKDIEFKETINILQDINSLYILFHESWKSYNNRSKKIYIKSNKLKRNNKTKRLKSTTRDTVQS